MAWVAIQDFDGGAFGVVKTGDVFPLAKLGLPDGPKANIVPDGEYAGGLAGTCAALERSGYIEWRAGKAAPAAKKPAAKS